MYWKKLLFLPVWLLVLLTIFSAVALTMVFLRGWQESIPAYLVYVVSFYTLTVVCIFCAKVLPGRFRQLHRKIDTNALGHRYMTDQFFRTTLSLYRSLGINLLYVGLNLWLWHLLKSWWFIILAAYYGILAVMRFLLLRYLRRNEPGRDLKREWKRSSVCAHILLLINLSLSGAVLMILRWNRGYDYPGVMIYVAALYTFYSVIHAAADMVKYRHLGSPVMTTAKIVSLSAALVSMLNLETAMFAQFGGEMRLEHQRLFIILTGAGVSVIVVTLSLGLIIKATKEIRRMKNGE